MPRPPGSSGSRGTADSRERTRAGPTGSLLLFRAGSKKGEGGRAADSREGGAAGLPRGGAPSRPRGRRRIAGSPRDEKWIAGRRRHPCFLAARARAGRPLWTPAKDADPDRRPLPTTGGEGDAPGLAWREATETSSRRSRRRPEQGWRERRPARSGRPQFAAGVELRRRAASPRCCSKSPLGPTASPRRGRSSVRRRRSGGAGIRRAGEDVAVTSSPPLLLAGRAAGEHKEAHAAASASDSEEERRR
jgi:hypothetical protein